MKCRFSTNFRDHNRGGEKVMICALADKKIECEGTYSDKRKCPFWVSEKRKV